MYRSPAIINSDRLDIALELVNNCAGALKDVVDAYFSAVTGYIRNTFLRAKLHDTLKKNAIDLELFENLSEAKKHLG